MLKTKSRGGKQARRRKEDEMEQKQSSVTQKFPAIRYSEDETAALLKLAYATLPERAGKRGTRNLKREAERWKLVRRIRYKYKQEQMAAHERRMEKRHWKREQVKEEKRVAPSMRVQDLNYQGQVLRRWAETMFGDAGATAAVMSAEEEDGGEKSIRAKD